MEIGRLDYEVTQAFQFSLHTRATMKVIAGNGGAAFERFYRVENEKKVMIVPPDEVNAEIINGILSDSINRLLNDRELMGFLAGP